MNHGYFHVSRSVSRKKTTASISIFFSILLSGCSFSYRDDAGRTHVIGLVDITLSPPQKPAQVAGNVLDLTTIGLSAGETAQGEFFSVGYFHEVSAELKDNALVFGNPLEIIKPIQSSDQEVP